MLKAVAAKQLTAAKLRAAVAKQPRRLPAIPVPQRLLDWSSPIELLVTPSLPPMSLNVVYNMHFSTRSSHVAAWREAGKVAALAAGVPQVPKGQRLHLLAVLRFSRPAGRDVNAGNWVPFLKAATDGLRDAGVLVEDTDKFVASSAVRELIVPGLVQPVAHSLWLVPEHMAESAYTVKGTLTP